MEKNKGGNQPISSVDRLNKPPSLKEIGITLNLSSEAQRLAELPEDEKEKGSIATCSIASLFPFVHLCRLLQQTITN